MHVKLDLDTPPATCCTVTVVMEALLPPELPPSYSGRLGRVVYVATVAIRKSDAVDMVTVNTSFRVRTVPCAAMCLVLTVRTLLI